MFVLFRKGLSSTAYVPRIKKVNETAIIAYPLVSEGGIKERK